MVAKLRPAASRDNPENLMSDEPGAVSAAGAGACFGASPGAAPKNPAADGDAGACFEVPLRGAPQHEGGGDIPPPVAVSAAGAGACFEAPLCGAPQHEGDGSAAGAPGFPSRCEGRAQSALPPHLEGDGGGGAVAARPGRKARGSSLPEVHRAELRLDYEAGELAIPELCEKYGLKQSQLRTIRELGGWVNRQSVGVPLRRRPATGPAERLCDRMRRSLLVQLLRLDARSGEGDPEAQARTLTELIRGGRLLAMTERQQKSDKAAEAGLTKKNNNAGPDPSLDPAFLRDELKRKLDRLRERPEPKRDHR